MRLPGCREDLPRQRRGRLGGAPCQGRASRPRRLPDVPDHTGACHWYVAVIYMFSLSLSLAKPKTDSPFLSGSIDCSRLADGAYSVGCTTAFTVCSNGFTYNQQCPDGLVFNPTRGYCDYPNNCGQAETSESSTVSYTASYTQSYTTSPPNGELIL